MDINIKELLPIQAEVNKVVLERLGRRVEIEEFILAFNVELFEYFNAVGTWKWWKQNHEVNRERVLDELADCFAFFLSIVSLSDELKLVDLKTDESIVDAFQGDLQKLHAALVLNSFEQEKRFVINGLISLIGTESETERATSTIGRFAIAIYIAQLLFEGITWEELTEAYRKKSKVNIERQEKNY